MPKLWIRRDKVYTWDELTPEARKNAVSAFEDDMRDVMDEELDYIKDDCEEALAQLGFKIARTRRHRHLYLRLDGGPSSIAWDGSYEFNAKSMDLLEERPEDVELHDIVRSLVALQQRNDYKICAEMRGDEYGFDAINSYLNDETYMNDMSVQEFDMTVKQLAQWMWERISEEQDYYLSEEYAVETMQEQGTLFFVDGSVAIEDGEKSDEELEEVDGEETDSDE